MTADRAPKLLMVMMKHDYGIESRGYSYEYMNVFLPLSDIYGNENILLFDFISEIKSLGKEAMNQKLLEVIRSHKPDITVFCLFEDEFDTKTVNSIREYTKTAAYFFDDPWRQKYVRKWISNFDYFSTPDYYMFRQYNAEGMHNAIYCPFGFNTSVYKKLDLPKIYDVSFVGGKSPLREWTIHFLEKEGIKVNVFGRGWGSKDKWVDQNKLIEIFNQSKINLNLSNSISYDFNYLMYSVRSMNALKEIILLKKHREQVKGRHYEINGCGGFQLSYFVPGLNTVYEIEKEIAVFDTVYNLPDMIRFYLQNDALRDQIAEEGYIRSQRDHSAQEYLKNFIDIISSSNRVL